MGFYYFAYGEHMWLPNMQQCAPHAKPIQAAKLKDYRLSFHAKRGDNSGKCDLIPCAEAAIPVYGVIYAIREDEKLRLNHHMHLGQETQFIEVCPEPLSEKADKLTCLTYVAKPDRVFEDLVPFDWYKLQILAGARYHQLPEEYIHCLEHIPSRADPNPYRAVTEERRLGSELL